MGWGFVFQQDNDLKLTSKFCKNYIATKKELKYMEWLPQLPDFNPIELLWDKLAEIDCKDAQSMFCCYKSEWRIL